MKIVVILAHPDPKSFNHAIARAAVAALKSNGHDVVIHDLYAEKFDPLLPAREIPKDGEVAPDVSACCDEISAAGGIVIVHPNWWGQPPAVLKGWIDRVIRPGTAYMFAEGDQGEGVPVGLLNASVAVVFNTSNTPAERENSVFGDPLEAIWKNCVFGLCGVSSFHRKVFSVVVTSTEEERRAWLSEVASTINGLFPQAKNAAEKFRD
ncbi:MAG: NAD(P)H-dependent oxidoreductase [Syntrophales bacterium]|nr:NAD(P)H-dependent oxidoreductase [Syntrophales bacterium]MDD5533864.1 NAD(P)H-dependent oxidoreductase [Syntrophales bacterium]